MYDKIDTDYTCQCDASIPTMITDKMKSTISTCYVVSLPVYFEVTIQLLCANEVRKAKPKLILR